jgi:hypothetical protein
LTDEDVRAAATPVAVEIVLIRCGDLDDEVVREAERVRAIAERRLPR